MSVATTSAVREKRIGGVTSSVCNVQMKILANNSPPGIDFEFQFSASSRNGQSA
jgi:hypothetical protein